MINLKFIFHSVKTKIIMKNNRPQPTSYKAFIEQINKNKVNTEKTLTSTPCSKPLQLSKKGNIHHCSTEQQSHCKSTLLWDKSSGKKTYHDENSIERKVVSHNQSLLQAEQTKNPSLSERDRTMCYHKFVNQFTSILSFVLKLSAHDFLTHRVSYIEYLQILKALKMIYNNYEPYPQDLVTELWSQLISGKNIGNMIIIMSIILGLQETKMTESQKYIKMKYQQLKFTRLQLQSCRNTSYRDENSTFRPMISQRSQELATSRSKSKSRRKKRHIKCLQPSSRIHTSGNSCQKISYDQNQCMLTAPNEMVHKSIDKTGNKRSDLLYRMAKQKSLGKREDKTKNQVQYQKNAQQLTFKPKINRNKSKDKLKKNQIKGEQTMISRMIRGRVEREVKKIIHQKGLPYNEKLVDRMKKEKYEQIISSSNFTFQHNSICLNQKKSEQEEPSTEQISFPPTSEAENQQVKENLISNSDLKIEVYIAENQKQELIVLKGDSLIEVAEKFIQQHGISEDKKQTLVMLLQKSMSHVLTPIDQLAEEQQQEIMSARTNRKARITH